MSEATTTAEPALRRCPAPTAEGRACHRPPLIGGEYCYVHDPHRRAGRVPRRERTGTGALMTAKEAAELLGWSLAATYEAVRQNRIPGAVLVRNGRALWFRRQALNRWLEGAEIAAAAAAVTG